MAEKSKILIIGGTGYIGKYIVEASAKAGHPTFALVRESTASNPEKAQVIESFKSSGVTLLNVCFQHLAHVLFDTLV
jgi:nucleoside-diphosphate-sugar epimerase